MHDSFAAGMQWSFRVVAAIALIGFLISVLFVGRSVIGRGEPAERATAAS